MNLRNLALLVCLFFPLAFSGCAHETPAEHAANQYAAAEKAAAPADGNLPDYSLKPADLAKAQHLEATGNVMNFVGTVWSILQVVLLLWLGVIAWMRDTSLKAGSYKWAQLLVFPIELLTFVALIDLLPALLLGPVAYAAPRAATIAEILVLLGSTVFVLTKWRWFRQYAYMWAEGFTFFLLFLIIGFILDLPLHLYGHHLGLAYGLSVQGWGSWFWDNAKSMMLSWVFGGLLVMLLFWVIRKWPRRWWTIFWVLSIPITLVAIFVGPYIGFLFNKYEPLQKSHPELVAQLEQVVRKGNMNIPPERMFLMKASEKVTTLNADVEGFGATKRVVVWDNTITKMTPDEVLGVFGHESGHYVLGHITRGVLMSLAITFFTLWLGYLFVQWSLRRFGARWRIPDQGDWGALAVLFLAFGLYGVLLEPLGNTLSRTQEHAADVYGQEAIHGIVANPQTTMQGAFQVLGENSYDVPNPSLFEEFWLENHPSLGRRAAFAHAYDPWAAGMQPKYFAKTDSRQ